MRTIRVLLCCLLWMQAAQAAPPIQRVAVLDFQNAGPDKTFDWIGTGVASKLGRLLSQGYGLTIVERMNLDNTLKELKFTRSSYAAPATALKIGKMTGADSLILGSFTKINDRIQITARLVNVETNKIPATAGVEGQYLNLLDLERELAARLLSNIQGAKAREERAALRFEPEMNLEAYRAFSDGLYFYRQDFLPDALRLFDEALKLEPHYPEAQFYRGLTLKEMSRTDEAIAAFKAALPGAEAPQQLVWKWDVPAGGERSDRGWLTVRDMAELNAQSEVLRRDSQAALEKRFAYAVHDSKSTTLHLVDPNHHRSEAIQVPNKHVQADASALSNDRMSIVFAYEAPPGQLPSSFTLYGAGDGDKSARWHVDIGQYGAQLPAVGLVTDSVYVFYPVNRKLTVLDDESGRVRWVRENIDFDRNEPPHVRKTAAHGNTVILKSPNAIYAIGVADGVDAWKIEPKGAFTFTLTDKELVLFEFGRAVSIVDLETGKVKASVGVPQATRNVELPHFGAVTVAQASVQNGIVYFQSKNDEFYAVVLDDAAKAQPVRWHVPLKATIESVLDDGNRLFAGTRTGEFMIFDGHTGAVTATVKIAAKDLRIEHAGADLVVANSEKAVYGLDAKTGKTRWEFTDAFGDKQLGSVQGVVTARTSETQTAFLDMETGAVLWTLTADRKARIRLLRETVAVMDENGMREYEVHSPGEELSVSNAEVLAELANAFMAKGDLKQAEASAAKLPRDLNLPSVHALRARLAAAKEDRTAEFKELSAWAAAAGHGSEFGQKAIAELKKNHRLLWSVPVEPGVAGVLTPVGDKLINVDLAIKPDSRIAAFDPETGAVAWRQPAERFSHVAVDAKTERAWYVSGDARDPAQVVLYALNMKDGEREEIARWTQAKEVGLAAVAYGAERLFVFSVSADFPNGKETVFIDCFATSGKRVWSKTQEFTANIIEARFAAGVFAVQDGVLVYSTGYELWTVKAEDGEVIDHHREEALISRIALKNEAPVVVITTEKEIVTYDVAHRTINGRRPFPLAEKLLELKMAGDRLWALREDGVLVEMDNAGQPVAEHPLPWLPASFTIGSKQIYAVTSDGFAYALQL